MSAKLRNKLVSLGALPDAASRIDGSLSGGVHVDGRDIVDASGDVLCTIRKGVLSPHETDVLAKYIAALLRGSET